MTHVHAAVARSIKTATGRRSKNHCNCFYIFEYTDKILNSTHQNMKSILSIFALLLCITCYAQVPQLINYQAVARNASGNIIANQTVSIQLSIRDGSPTATIVYQENDTATTNQFGLFTVVIGAGQVQVGTFSGINWSSGNKYIQVGFDPTAANSGNVGTDYAVFSEIENSGVAPPTVLIDSQWVPRQLNHTDDISGTSIAINGNQITLQPGKYHVSASAQWGFSVENVGNGLLYLNGILKLADTSNTTILIGQAEHPFIVNVQPSGYLYGFNSIESYSNSIEGILTITTTTTLTMQHYISAYPNYSLTAPVGSYTYTTNAGIPMSIGENEVYSRILIQKIN